MTIRPLDAVVAVSLLLGLAAVAGLREAPTERVTGTVRVVDGDTLVQDGRRIRLRDMDAPELDQTCRGADGAPYRCGELARAALRQLVEAGPVTCDVTGQDRYGRALARCAVGAVDLGRDLVLRGLAVSYGGYRAEERAARSRSLGVWAGPFDPPVAWRKAHPRDGFHVAETP